MEINSFFTMQMRKLNLREVSYLFKVIKVVCMLPKLTGINSKSSFTINVAKQSHGN